MSDKMDNPILNVFNISSSFLFVFLHSHKWHGQAAFWFVGTKRIWLKKVQCTLSTQIRFYGNLFDLDFMAYCPDLQLKLDNAQWNPFQKKKPKSWESRADSWYAQWLIKRYQRSDKPDICGQRSEGFGFHMYRPDICGQRSEGFGFHMYRHMQ